MVDQYVMHALFQPSDLAGRGLQLDQHHGLGADHGQGFGQGRNGVIAAIQRIGLKIGGAVVADAARPARHALQGFVVKHHGLAIGRKAHVQLDAKAAFSRVLKGRQAVFRRAVRRPQTAMRKGRSGQPGPGLAKAGDAILHQGAHATSTTASISTAKPSGN